MLGRVRPEEAEVGDQAFVLRLPQNVATRVREILRSSEDGVREQLKIKVDSRRGGYRLDGARDEFNGRTGSVTIGHGTPEEIKLPASLMQLPTLVEMYRTVDGRTGDYIKCADVSQIMVAHEVRPAHAHKRSHAVLVCRFAAPSAPARA
jgi:TATA-binding protein-associated factor Taf7